VVAVRRFELGLDAGAPTIGFDLDGVCTTCEREGGAGESCATTSQHCDDDQGRDNTTQTLFRDIQTFGVDIEANLNANVQAGFSTFVIRVQNYNGLQDDPDVFVSVFGSSGLRHPLDDGGVTYSAPAFDGGDRWSVARDQLAQGLRDKYISAQGRGGYVAGHTLVVPQATASVPLREGVSANLQAIVLVATIDPTGTTITDGTLGGRWPVGDALTVIGELPVPASPDQPLCGNPVLFGQVKQAICSAADLTVDGGASTCDALSLALAFTTSPALLGDILDLTPMPARCRDPSTFQCP
jgi:hypothetical protein